LKRRLKETLGVPSSSRSSQAWSGFSGPLGVGQNVVPGNRDLSQPWPYRTATAEVVWKYAADLIPKHPEMNEADVLKRAIEISGVDPLDLSPEDWRLLEMAIEWRKNGVTGLPRPRIGGAPGGPFDSRDMGRYMLKRRVV